MNKTGQNPQALITPAPVPVPTMSPLWCLWTLKVACVSLWMHTHTHTHYGMRVLFKGWRAEVALNRHRPIETSVARMRHTRRRVHTPAAFSQPRTLTVRLEAHTHTHWPAHTTNLNAGDCVVNSFSFLDAADSHTQMFQMSQCLHFFFHAQKLLHCLDVHTHTQTWTLTTHSVLTHILHTLLANTETTWLPHPRIPRH